MKGHIATGRLQWFLAQGWQLSSFLVLLLWELVKTPESRTGITQREPPGRMVQIRGQLRCSLSTVLPSVLVPRLLLHRA